MLKIIVKNRKTATEQSYQFKKNTVIVGRGRQCDIVLESDTVSRQHAQWHIGKDELFLEDLGSGNGTFVNNKPIPPRHKIPLKNEDHIRIEDFELNWQIEKQLPEFQSDSPLNSTDPDILEIKMIKRVIGALGRVTTPQLIIVSDPFEKKTLNLEDTSKTFTIGREPDCDLTLDSPILSRKHAQISCKWGTYVIKDLKSKNGTFVNNQPATDEISLKDQDQISFGTIQAVFHQPGNVNFSEIEKSLHDEKPKPTPEDSQSIAARQTAEPAASSEPTKKPATTEPAPKPTPAAAPVEKELPKSESTKPKEPPTESSEDILKSLPVESAEPALVKSKSRLFQKNLSPLEWGLLVFGLIVLALIVAALVILL